ncbi:MAG: ABC transporter ATP-binding protein [Pontiellaceae bacterium]|nr:ABC transporter ATP-binding protein [Pontiellaceae bacterium]
MSGFLEFEGISKSFGDLKALDNVSLSIRQGEIFSLLGPSGCGKTTLLRICAGFEMPDAGRVLLNGKDITDLPPNRRAVNTIFQNYALFPNMTLRENIAFGLQIAKVPKKEIADRVETMLQLVQLEHHAHKRPHQISGGQKQRVAIARALVNRPQVLLLDEPLAALDLKLRQRMLVELDGIHDEVGTTFVYVTHDQSEAMGLSDRIAVFNHGVVEQVGSSTEIYEAPRTSFTAAFIGDTNFFNGRVCERIDSEYCQIEIEGLEPRLRFFNDKNLREQVRVDLSVRPEKFSISRTQPAPDPLSNTLRGTVEDVIYLGSHTKWWVRVNEEYLISVTSQHSRFLLDSKPIRWNEAVWISWHADDGYMLERYDENDEALLVLSDAGLPDDIPPDEEAE